MRLLIAPDKFKSGLEWEVTWKESLDGANNTGWSLYYIAFRSVERSPEDILAQSPQTHGNHATA
jgi:hypothetical protein